MSVFGLRTLIQNFLFFPINDSTRALLFVCRSTDKSVASSDLCVLYRTWFFNLFYHVPKIFLSRRWCPTIKILLKNTKSIQVYCDFFHGICSSQYEQWIGINKLNNVTFQSRKIKGFWENQADIYDRWIELASPKNHFMSPLWGRVPKVEKLGYRKTVPLLE